MISCEETRDLAPELALGIAVGEERADALDHIATCQSCRRHLEELSTVADEMLLLAPSQEPPAGFESRVLNEIVPAASTRRRRPNRLRRWIPQVALATTAAIAAASGMWLALGSDRELANHYRNTLHSANGKYFDAAKLTTAGGHEAGHVFTYEGAPSWVLVTVESASSKIGDGRYRVELITESGTTRLRPLEVKNGSGSAGQAIPSGVGDVHEVRLLGPNPGDALAARFGGH